MLTNMAVTSMFGEDFACLWLDMIKICHLSAIFANPTFTIISVLV
jgi:hypothetical protein